MRFSVTFGWVLRLLVHTGHEDPVLARPRPSKRIRFEPSDHVGGILLGAYDRIANGLYPWPPGDNRQPLDQSHSIDTKVGRRSALVKRMASSLSTAKGRCSRLDISA